MSATFASTAQPIALPQSVGQIISVEAADRPTQSDQTLQLQVGNPQLAPMKAPAASTIEGKYTWEFKNSVLGDAASTGKIYIENYNSEDNSVNVKFDSYGTGAIVFTTKGTYDPSTGVLSIGDQKVGQYDNKEVEFLHCVTGTDGNGFIGGKGPLEITFTDEGVQIGAEDFIVLRFSDLSAQFCGAHENKLTKIVKDYAFNIWIDTYCNSDNIFPLYIEKGEDVAGIRLYTVGDYIKLTDSLADAIMGANNLPTASLSSSYSALGYSLTTPGVKYINVVAFNSDKERVAYKQLIAIVPDRSEEGWTTLGSASFDDQLIAPAFSQSNTITCEFQESNTTPGRYRLVNPYANSTNEVFKEGHNYHKHYVYINATNPEDAYLEPSVLGWGLSNSNIGDFAAWSYVDYLAVINGLNHAQVASAIGATLGKKEDNKITLYPNALSMSQRQSGAFGNYSNLGPLVITLTYNHPLPADILGYYSWTYTTGISAPESAKGNVVLSDYNAEDKSVAVTINGYKLKATYDVATGTLSLPTNQPAGSAGGLNVNFYHGTGTPGNGFTASDEPLVGTVTEEAITFGENDYILFGDMGDNGGYTLYAYTNTWTKTEAPKTDYSLTAKIDYECPANGIFNLKLHIGASIATVCTYFQKKYVEDDGNVAQQVAEKGDRHNVTGELTLPFQTIGEGIYSVAVVALDADGNIVAKAFPYFVVNDTKEEGWTTVGTATFDDRIFAQSYKGEDSQGNRVELTPETLTCELQECDATEGRYRLVNPYAGSKIFPDVAHDGHSHYLFVNASDPGDAYIEPSIVGPQNYGQAVVWSTVDQLAMRFGVTRAYVANAVDGAELGTMADDVITLPNTSISERDYLNGDFKMVGTLPLVIKLNYEIKLPEATFTDPEGHKLESASHKSKVVVTFNHDSEKVSLYYRFEEAEPVAKANSAARVAASSITDESGNEYSLYDAPLEFEKSGTLYYLTQDARNHKSEIGSLDVVVGGNTSGIDNIEADAEARYFNMQGMPVEAPAEGEVVIRVSGGKATKVIFK